MSILNFSDITNENRADFHSLMRTYAKELDEHQNKVTDSEALEKWTDRIIEKQHDNGWCLKLCCDGCRNTAAGDTAGKCCAIWEDFLR